MKGKKFGLAKRQMRPPPSSPPSPAPLSPLVISPPPRNPLPPRLAIPYFLAISEIENTRFCVFEKKRVTDGPTDGPTDRQMNGQMDRRTDGPYYRDSWTHLKTSITKN